MTSFGGLTAAILSGSQELVATLGVFNFDFSLVKLEAPSQFRGLGDALTKTRREIAESGRTHVTARKLGALFDDVIPRTPRLVEAYGTRVSEIARSPLANPRSTSSDGIFADYAGADGTSIWAAATSGNSAIAVHLLACMLARMWSITEAISIWVEIVEARKRELMGESNRNEPFKLANMLAAQVVIDRDQLAEWDNSARASLRRADEAKLKEQTQLMLILNNLSIAVNAKIDTYSSVMSALTTALVTIEELLSGRPQHVQDGGALLALSCWHIYPDLVVLGHKTAHQKDVLVPENGKLTLGLEDSSAKRQSGVYWCMSLSHMRHYGPPVQSERSLSTSSSRLSFDQLVQVALGSVIRGWGFRTGDSLEATNVVTKLHETILSASKRSSKLPLLAKVNIIKDKSFDENWSEYFNGRPNWLRMLAKAGSMFTKVMQDGNELDRQLCKKLVALGHGRGAVFVEDPKEHPPAMFGLGDFSSVIDLLDDQEDRIALLRRYAHRFFPDAAPSDVIIRYRLDGERAMTKLVLSNPFPDLNRLHIEVPESDSDWESDSGTTDKIIKEKAPETVDKPPSYADAKEELSNPGRNGDRTEYHEPPPNKESGPEDGYQKDREPPIRFNEKQTAISSQAELSHKSSQEEVIRSPNSADQEAVELAGKETELIGFTKGESQLSSTDEGPINGSEKNRSSDLPQDGEKQQNLSLLPETSQAKPNIDESQNKLLDLNLGSYVPRTNCEHCFRIEYSIIKQGGQQKCPDDTGGEQARLISSLSEHTATLDSWHEKKYPILFISYQGTTYGLKFERGRIEDESLSVGELRDRVGDILGINEKWRICLDHGKNLLFRKDPLTKHAIQSGCVLECIVERELILNQPTEKPTVEMAAGILKVYEYATAVPLEVSEPANLQFKIPHYTRWLDPRLPSDPLYKNKLFPETSFTEILLPKSKAITDIESSSVRLGLEDKSESIMNFKEANPFSQVPTRPALGTKSSTAQTDKTSDKSASVLSNNCSKEFEDEKSDPERISEDSEENFVLFLGDPRIAAIYVRSKVHQAYLEKARQPYWASKRIHKEKRIELQDVNKILNSGAISAESLYEFLRSQSSSPFYRSLRALSLVEQIYSTLPSATINTEVTSLYGKSLTREQTFACISMLETGSLDLAASTFENVFAISAADSLYVAASLLTDPGLPLAAHEVRHVIGNIGRPGLALLIAPPEPQVLQPSAESWKVINREAYDGIQNDSFSGTSLHLRFSDWTMPVDIGDRGQGRRDIEASLVEGYIQVNNNGKWIADLDILTSFRRGYNQFDHDYYYKPTCNHKKMREDKQKEYLDKYPMTSIDSWEEFLDRPDGPAVVRAHKNWLARIATAVIGVQRHDRVLVGTEVCWECFADLVEAGGSGTMDKILFIN